MPAAAVTLRRMSGPAAEGFRVNPQLVVLEVLSGAHDSFPLGASSFSRDAKCTKPQIAIGMLEGWSRGIIFTFWLPCITCLSYLHFPPSGENSGFRVASAREQCWVPTSLCCFPSQAQDKGCRSFSHQQGGAAEGQAKPPPPRPPPEAALCQWCLGWALFSP